MLPLKICSQVCKFKSNIFGNWLNLWRHTYIYLVIALYRAISNTLQVCTIHSMWKSQKFITIKHWKFILCPHLPPSLFPSSKKTLNIFLDKYTYALWHLQYFGYIQNHKSVWVSFLWHCSNFLRLCNSLFELAIISRHQSLNKLQTLQWFRIFRFHHHSPMQM